LARSCRPKRHILKDISLSFFPGAKIGVLGTNGSGKSTLLKIMAGIDKEIEGEAIPMAGLKIGYLPQEPIMDAEQTVREAVESGMGEVKAAQEPAWKRCTPPTPKKTPTLTPWPPSRPSSKPSSPPPATLQSTSWKSPPMRCACPLGRHHRQAVGR
jgi:energy-coupling factor transporter ATP-binding protein EcfA2